MKRLFDAVVAGVGLVVLAPVIAATAVVVAVGLGRPVLFRQARAGLRGSEFEVLKFRTMLPMTPDRVSDAERLTPLGRFLRSTSLDELPSLWNVVRGDLSLVGPRPLPVRYLDRYTLEQARRHEVRPGITGLAQVRGRNRLSWEEKFTLDVEYVARRSFALDLAILAATVRVVLRRDGISADGEVTAREFLGVRVDA